ncbi:MAG: PKD-like family lipoprotein [Marinifilaceae bacterium]
MNTIKSYILPLCILLGLHSCYEDLGNYTYTDINEIVIDSIRPFYVVDQYDSLYISPVLNGTQYNDIDAFNYTWEMDNKVISNNFKLEYKVTNGPGEKYCRFIIEDKQTGIKEYAYFNTSVVSATAVDGILLLSNYKNHSELSFKRIDRENANFKVNFYYEINNQYLGINPQKFIQHFNYNKSDAADNYGLQIVSDKQVKRVSHITLTEDSVYSIYDKHYFKSILPASPAYPEFVDFTVDNLSSNIVTWMYFFGDPMNRDVNNIFMVGGKYYMTQEATIIEGVNKLSYERTTENGGELAPLWCSVSYTKNTTNDFFVQNTGYNISDYIIVYDKTEQKFAYGLHEGNIPFTYIQEFVDYDFEGYIPVFATPTRNQNNPIFIMSNGIDYRSITLQAPERKSQEYDEEKGTGVKFEVIADIVIPSGNITESTDFEYYIIDEDLYFTTDNAFYSVNIQGLKDGRWEAKELFRLTDYGYDNRSTINCFSFARSGKHVIFGIARDGKRKDISSDELNGDVLLFNINKSNNSIVLKSKYEKVGGTPVDIMIKHLTHFREGYDHNGNFRDYL